MKRKAVIPRIYVSSAWALLLVPASLPPAWSVYTGGWNSMNGLSLYVGLAMGAWRTAILASRSRVSVYKGRKRTLRWDEIEQIEVIDVDIDDGNSFGALRFTLASGEQVTSFAFGRLRSSRLHRIHRALEELRLSHGTPLPRRRG